MKISLSIISIFIGGIVLLFPSRVAYAQPNGAFSGVTNTQTFECLVPPSGPIPLGSSTMNITAVSNSVTINISGPDFTYSGSGTAVEISPNVFEIDPLSTSSFSVSGPVIPLITGGSESVTSAQLVFSFAPTSNSLVLVGFMLNGTGTSCSGFNINMGASSLSSVSGGADIIVDPVITPSSIITTPLILNTQVKAITSDLQFRINDVLRTIQLRRQQFPLPRDRRGREVRKSSLLPTDEGEVVVDTREQEDSQAPVLIRPTESGLMLNSLSGLNAGDNPWLMGAWASYSYTDFENDFASTAFDGRRHGGLAGIDASPWEEVLFGMAVGYEDNDIDTTFNLGNQQTDGYTIAPYFGALLTDTWSVSFSFGYSNLDTDQFRTLPGTTTRVTSSSDHDRWFGMLNLNGLTTYGNWILSGHIGILHAQDEQDAFLESDGTQVADFQSKLGQWNIGGEAAYSFDEFEPFVRATYENDFSQTEVGVIGGPQPSFDEDDVLFGVGLRYFGAKGLTGNLEYNTRLGREDFDEDSFTATIRYEF
jgi:outer membrane autotransporter barrel domain